MPTAHRAAAAAALRAAEERAAEDAAAARHVAAVAETALLAAAGCFGAGGARAALRDLHGALRAARLLDARWADAPARAARAARRREALARALGLAARSR